MSDSFQPFIGQALRRVLYYRPEAEASTELNWPGFHDVGQGVELVFDTGRFFVTWDTAADEELSIRPGCMVDFLRMGVFEDVSAHPDWQGYIGRPLEALRLLPNEAAVQIGGQQVFIVTAEVDPDTLLIEGMADNLVVFFSPELRNAFFAQYPGTPAG